MMKKIIDYYKENYEMIDKLSYDFRLIVLGMGLMAFYVVHMTLFYL